MGAGQFLGWIDDKRPLDDHGHASNFTATICKMVNPGDTRAIAEFRAAYKRKIDEGCKVNMAVELSYVEMLTPEQINLIGGVRAVTNAAYRYSKNQTDILM